MNRWRENGMKTKMCTARPTWQTMSFRRSIYKNYLYCIDIDLHDILDIDTDRKVNKIENFSKLIQMSCVYTIK